MTPGDELKRLMQSMLGLEEDELASDRPLGELGIDSLTAAELSLTLEEEHGLDVPLERFLGQDTLDDILRDLEVTA